MRRLDGEMRHALARKASLRAERQDILYRCRIIKGMTQRMWHEEVSRLLELEMNLLEEMNVGELVPAIGMDGDLYP